MKKQEKWCDYRISCFSAVSGSVGLVKLGSKAVKLAKAGELTSTVAKSLSTIPRLPAQAGQSILTHFNQAKSSASAFGKTFMTELSKGGVTTSINGAGDLSKIGKATVAGAKEAKSVFKASGSTSKTLSRVMDDGADIKKASGADDINKLPEIEVNFNKKPKHDAAEFARQLENQQKGMNELTVQEYLDNRSRYISDGRAIEGNAAQQAAREKALSNKIEELFGQGISWESAEKEATSWMNSQAALHNPDQIAGGNASIIGGMGDKGINSSLGAQWKYRIDTVDEQIREMAKNMTPEQLKHIHLNVKLTH